LQPPIRTVIAEGSLKDRHRFAWANTESVTVKSDDGFVGYLLSDDTTVREDRDDAALSDIDASDRILVVATKDGSTLNARRLVVPDN
jgi:hypothetical protein